MKHPWKITSSIFLWLITSVILAIWAAPYAVDTLAIGRATMRPVVWIITVVVLILLGALMWTFMIKKANPKTIDVTFAVGLGLVASRGITIFFPELNTGMYGLLSRFILMTLFASMFMGMLLLMRKNWAWSIRLSPVSNLFMIWTTVIAATIIAVDVPGWVTLVILGLAAIYDAWAVWKSKTMIHMAKFFIKRRILPGIAIPYKNKEEFALLGGGDVFFVVLVSISFYQTSVIYTLTIASGMILAIAGLFLFSKKDTFYPALPFIFTGAILGLALGWLL